MWCGVQDVVFGTTRTSHFSLCITVGFFLFECSALGISDVIFKTFSFLLNLHHWLSLVSNCSVCRVLSFLSSGSACH